MTAMIGITSFVDTTKSWTYTSLNVNYSYSVAGGGGFPVIIPGLDELSVNEHDKVAIDNMASFYVSKIDGLLLSGGADISPYIYGEEPIKAVTTMNYKRDVWEIALCKAAILSSKPVLGICRGCQLVNVALGGTLYQDIPTQMPNANGHSFTVPMDEPVHSIKIERGSRLYEAFGQEALLVNSFHHQAVKKLGQGLVVSAVSPDGVIEAIESTNKNQFILAVQFHPEGMTRRFNHFLKLFSLHIDEAKAL